MFYEILRIIGMITGFPVNWVFFKRKVYYENGTKRRKLFKGGALIIANHYSPWDYLLHCFTVFPRKLWVVASEDAFRNKGLRFGMKFAGGIEANRITKNMSFMSKSVKQIRSGNLVMIFPEGHNTDDGTIKRFYPSYILIALRAKAPIIPIVSDGNYGMLKRLHMIIGEPIDLSTMLPNEKFAREDIDRLNDQVRQKVLDLREELDRRIEADKRKKGKK